jgi:hypothetical protein
MGGLLAVGLSPAQQPSLEAQRLAMPWGIILKIQRPAQRKPKTAMALAHIIK